MSVSWDSSIAMRAMHAKAQDVLHEPLVVGEVRLGLAARELHAHTAEFRRRPVDHDARALRLERRRLGGEDFVRKRRAARGIEPIEARADSPLRHELVHRLHVTSLWFPRILRLLEPLALQLAVGLARIAVRRPLPD